jgi:adenylate cyclase
LIAVHSIVEGALRPARVAIAGDTGTGDSLPRSRPTFTMWSNISMLAVAFSFSIGAAMLGAALNQISEKPVLAVVTGCVALGFAVPITVGAGFAPSLRPIRDLAEGTERVAAGDYSQRLPAGSAGR